MLDKLVIQDDNPEEMEPDKKSILDIIRYLLKIITIGKKRLGIHYLDGVPSYSIRCGTILTCFVFSFLFAITIFLIMKLNTRKSDQVSYIDN